jgi:AcrR family transcriptional regulator
MERTLTEKGQATRQRIIAGAAAEVRARGVANTSLDDVRAATGTSKSQLFHYFPDGRAELLRAVARHEAEQVLADQRPQLDDLSSWRAWTDWRDLVLHRYQQQGRHCPLSVLVAQLGPHDPEAGAIVVDLLTRWQAAIATGVREMQRRGKIAERIDPDTTAAAILAGIQGGVVIMLATGDSTNLAAALDMALARLREAR